MNQKKLLWLIAGLIVILGILCFAPAASNYFSGRVTADDIAVKKPWTDVRYYGAVGGDVEKDTTAFKAAIAAAGEGGTIYIPGNSTGYYINEVLKFKKGQRFVGDGIQGGSKIQIAASGLDSLFAPEDARGYPPPNNMYMSVQFENLWLYGGGNAVGVALVDLTACLIPTSMKHCILSGYKGAGKPAILLRPGYESGDGCTGVNLQHLWIIGDGSTGGTAKGIVIQGFNGKHSSFVHDIVMNHITIESIGNTNCIYVESSGDAHVHNIWADNLWLSNRNGIPIEINGMYASSFRNIRGMTTQTLGGCIVKIDSAKKSESNVFENIWISGSPGIKSALIDETGYPAPGNLYTSNGNVRYYAQNTSGWEVKLGKVELAGVKSIGAGAPDVSGGSHFRITSSGTITGLSYGKDAPAPEGQIVVLRVEGNYTVTIVNGAIALNQRCNWTMHNGDVLCLIYSSGAWRETGRSNAIEYETVTNKGPATLDVDYPATRLDASGGAVNATLPDGRYVGQIKTIYMTAYTAPHQSTITVAHHLTGGDNEQGQFSAIDDTWILVWMGTHWATLFANCAF